MSNRDYTKFSKPEVTPIEEATVEEVVGSEPEPKIGIVHCCEKLNLRKEPSITSEVVCVIDRLTEVVIDESESTEDFYKVCTPAGVEGFCVKLYIKTN